MVLVWSGDGIDDKGEISMNSESHNDCIYFGNDRRTFERASVSALGAENHKEQAFKETCQEIVDLYKMLQNKCIQGRQVLDLKTNSVTTPNTH
jgi:hypothetical protein